MKPNKHDDMCPCTRFRAQDEFCTCGAVERAEIVADTSKNFAEHLRRINSATDAEIDEAVSALRNPPPQPTPSVGVNGKATQNNSNPSTARCGDLVNVLHPTPVKDVRTDVNIREQSQTDFDNASRNRVYPSPQTKRGEPGE